MPKFKYESSPEDSSPKRDSTPWMIPPGYYNLVIREVEERWTKNNDPMIRALCSVSEPTSQFNGKNIYYNVPFIQPGKPGASIATHFLKVIGEPHEGKFDVDPENWIGKRFFAKVATDKVGNKEYVNIKSTMDPTDKVPFDPGVRKEWELKEAKKKGGDKEEEVPF